MKKHIAITAIALALLLSGCSKLTKENYYHIKMGMSYDEVVGLIGTPSECQQSFGIKSCQWKSGEKEVSVGFIGDNVTVYSSKNLK